VRHRKRRVHVDELVFGLFGDILSDQVVGCSGADPAEVASSEAASSEAVSSEVVAPVDTAAESDAGGSPTSGAQSCLYAVWSSADKVGHAARSAVQHAGM
jgi:hypothetical protein